MGIVVEFDEESLRHYCRLHMPELNRVLSIDHIDCALSILSDKPCELCERFKNAIKNAILREAGRRLKEGDNE